MAVALLTVGKPALASDGWFLMEPPFYGDEVFKDAPITQWYQVGAYSSAGTCGYASDLMAARPLSVQEFARQVAKWKQERLYVPDSIETYRVYILRQQFARCVPSDALSGSNYGN
jgi:hypothetical protein